MLSKAGLQVPVIELVDVVGKIKFVPEQIDAGRENAGVTIAFTVIFLVTDFAHNPEVGVKV